MSTKETVGYLVRSGGQYLVVSGDNKRSWTPCNRCASRFSRDAAHLNAHRGGNAHRVVRLVKP